MAKRPRMGRNLNALLGSSARERADTSANSNQLTQDPALEDKPQKQSPAEVAEHTIDSQASGGNANEHKADMSTPDEQNAATTDKSHDILISNESGDQLIMLAVEKIRRGTYQPRRLFDKELLQELADSIKAEGMIQPIIVRPFADGFELVAGERRWRAAQLAGMDRIPAIVRSMEDKSVAAVSVLSLIHI